MVRRIIAICMTVLILATLPICVQATDARTVTVIPKLSFVGTTANCSAIVIGASANDSLYAVIKLWYGSTCLKTWTATGTGIIRFDDTLGVTINREYTLTIDTTVNNISNQTVSISGRCQ